LNTADAPKKDCRTDGRAFAIVGSGLLWFDGMLAIIRIYKASVTKETRFVIRLLHQQQTAEMMVETLL
jgi:hypothetical protein